MSEAADTSEVANTPSGRERAPAPEGQGPEIPDNLTYRVVLPEFEGPLDLLLFLCKSHEIDILDIPIAFVTEKYLEYLDLMQSLSVEVAAEYLVMAATLAYLKSRELVPAPEPLDVQADDAEESGDPKEELIRRLLEYQKYKDAAEQLGNRPIEGKNVFGRGMPVSIEKGPEVLAEHSPWKLIEHFADLLKDAPVEHTHDVVIDRMSVAQRINQLIDKLEAGEGSFRFDSIIDFTLPLVELRHQVVVTLLAVLELAKLKAIRVLQDPVSETFFVARASSTSDEVLRRARQLSTTSDGEADRAAAVEATAEEELPRNAEAAEAEASVIAETAVSVEEAAVSVEEAAVDVHDNHNLEPQQVNEEPDGQA
ncbi:MAG: segregation/condensation protein A [Myxococcales bacterium]|nr:segregation/condensation protein A [Myxococcales bacterium]